MAKRKYKDMLDRLAALVSDKEEMLNKANRMMHYFADGKHDISPNLEAKGRDEEGGGQ